MIYRDFQDIKLSGLGLVIVSALPIHVLSPRRFGIPPRLSAKVRTLTRQAG